VFFPFPAGPRSAPPRLQVLLSTSLCGVLFAIFSGQPLVIVGVTGPVSIFSVTLYNIADALGVPFLPWWVSAQEPRSRWPVLTERACLLARPRRRVRRGVR
jgi:hypothetical protein